MSFFSVTLAGFYSRLVLTDSFQKVVMVGQSVPTLRDVTGYYRKHGSSFEQAHRNESWADYQVSLSPPPGLEDRPPGRFDSNRLITTDLNHKVWIPNIRFAVGDTVPEELMQDAAPILDSGKAIGYFTVDGQLALSGTEAQYITDLTNSLWVSFLLVAFIAVPLGVVLGNRFTKPINNLNSAVSAMHPHAISQSVPITSNDEIGLLSQSFNQMSKDLSSYVGVIEDQKEKIEATETMRKQGLVSISHELRTPLYRLVSQAYAMLDGVRPLDRDEMTKLADSLDHLSELVKDLHHLALSDVHAFSCDIEPTDLSLIIRNAIESRKEVFAKKTFSINTSVPEQLLVDGDPTRLRQIVDNLFSNCLRYTKDQGEITVELTTDDKFAELVVSDNGPGVPSASLDTLFDRFYRVESSRNRATGGSGLGLSLVATCAEMHGGNVAAFQSEQGGLGIRVRVPLQSVH